MRCRLTQPELDATAAELGVHLPASDDFALLGQSVAIGDRTTPNRFVALPMEGADALADGSPGELTFRRYERMAAGGAGIIWLEACAVVPEGRSGTSTMHLHEKNVQAYASLVTRMREAARAAMGHEILCILQLTHAGRHAKPAGTPGAVMASHCPVLDAAGDLPSDYPLVTDAQLDEIQDGYIRTAQLAATAGFDGVDIKACHGYLISSLLGGHERPGKYGGDYEGRTRFLKQTIARAQQEIPGVLVTTRLNLFDGLPKPYGFGSTQDDPATQDMREPLRLVGELAEMGLPLLSISMGLPRFDPHYGRPSAGMKQEHQLVGISRLLEATKQVQQAIPDTPVISLGLGWLEEHFVRVAAGVVETGVATLVGQGRNSIAYPDSVSDILNSHFVKNKTCVTCAGCSRLLRAGGPVGCIVRDRETYKLPTG